MVCNFDRMIADIDDGQTDPIVSIYDTTADYMVRCIRLNGMKAGWLRYHTGEASEATLYYDVAVSKDPTNIIGMYYSGRYILLNYILDRNPLIEKFLSF